MSDPQAPLKNLQPRHDYLVAIDSDGCAFDTMEIKHKECFIPNIIKYWNLQPVSKYARAAAEFVNLYSKWRGINRFPALIMVFDLLQDWDEVQQRGFPIPRAQAVRDWIQRETKLGNPALKTEVEKTHDPVLNQALAWSEAVNAAVADMVHDVPPFPFVRESLEKLSQWADIIVCSATPNEAIEREWEEHNIAKYTRAIAGQERGSKKEHLALTAPKYSAGHVLMIGDAPGDMKAAHNNGLMFYPVNPGKEEKSWERFFQTIAQQFAEGHYDTETEARLIAEFQTYLPEIPPWK
jgi:phosphoglycolate phosphatase-like HAD superfamily hydrolase